jgi:hypothetical protein
MRNPVDFFESLEDINQLVADMTEVTTACLANIILPQNSIAIKNLLIFGYIINVNHINAIILYQKRAEFKDWLGEKVTQQLKFSLTKPSVTGDGRYATTELCNAKQNDNENKSLSLPKTPLQAPKTRSDLCRKTYSIEVFQVSFSVASENFDSAAAQFNKNFICNISNNCKIIKKERYRKTQLGTSQLYKCNCCTTDVILQFQHRNPDNMLEMFPQTQCSYVVQVFIKNNMTDKFRQHFRRKRSNSNRSVLRVLSSKRT